jgi:hypothetical protein
MSEGFYSRIVKEGVSVSTIQTNCSSNMPKQKITKVVDLTNESVVAITCSSTCGASGQCGIEGGICLELFQAGQYKPSSF